MKWTIRARLILGYSAVLVMLSGTSAVVLYGQNKAAVLQDRIASLRIPMMGESQEMSGAIAGAKVGMRDMMLAQGDTEAFAKARGTWAQAWERANASMPRIREHATHFVTDRDKERVHDLDTSLVEMSRVHRDAVALLEADDFEQGAHVLAQTGVSVGKKIDELLAELTAAQREFAERDSALMSELGARNKATLIWASAAAIGVGAVAAFLTLRSILRPLGALSSRLSDIAHGEGDLTVRLNDSAKDELGDVSRSFNHFVEKIRCTIDETGQAAQQVAAAATQIATASEEMSRSVDLQQQQATQVSAAIAEMTASIGEIASKASQTASCAKESGDLAGRCGDAVATTVSDMSDINTVVDESSREIQRLGQMSEKIGEIVSVINEIADQTNLLALNAAIEAARAGEHGRGFAVVADEVRKLAERTTQATTEVGESIKGIREGTQHAVERVESAAERARAGTTRAGTAGEGMAKIVNKAQEVDMLVQSIAAASEEQSAAAEQVSRSIESVATSTRESASGTQQAAAAATELSTRAESLRKLVSQFKTKRA